MMNYKLLKWMGAKSTSMRYFFTMDKVTSVVTQGQYFICCYILNCVSVRSNGFKSYLTCLLMMLS